MDSVWQRPSVIMLFLLLTIASTLPLILEMGHVTRFQDSRMYLWSIWWWRDSIVGRFSNPFHTSHICYPNELSLYFQNRASLMMTLAIPLTFIFSVEWSYNIIVLASFVLTGYGTYLLCRHVTGNEYASIVGGSLFAFSAIRFHWVDLGWVNNLSCQWIPFYVLYLLKSMKDGGRMNNLLAGVFLAFTAMTQLEHLVYVTLITAVVCAYSGVKAFRKTIPAFMVFLIVSSPVMIPTLMETFPPKYVNPLMEEVVSDSADALGLLIPAPDNPLFKKCVQGLYSRFKTTPYVRVSFAGYTTLALAGYCIMKRRGRDTYLWATVAGLFYLLSLGPVVHVLGVETAIPGAYNIFRLLPAVGAMRFVNRFTLITQMGLAILAAMGFARISEGMGSKRLIALTCIALAFGLLESSSPVDMMKGYGKMGAYTVMNEGSVLHIPYRSNDAMYVGVMHGRPLVNCFLPRKPIIYPEAGKIRALQPVLNRMQNPGRLRGYENAGGDMRVLEGYDVRYVTVEKSYYKNGTEDLKRLMDSMGATILGEDDDIMVFGLP
ncbi:MAG: hypothetical protein ABIH11_07910 [Candidatus Altiarchaeota archaeon]